MINDIIQTVFGNEQEEEEEEKEEEKEDEEEEKNTYTKEKPTPSVTNRDTIAPTTFLEESEYIKSGSDFVKVLFVLNWPDEPDPMFLEELLYQTPIDSDISLHVSPREKDKAIEKLKDEMRRAGVKAENDETGVGTRSKQRHLQKTKRVHDALVNTDANLHEISMYITVRDEDRDSLDKSVNDMVRKMRTNSMYPEVLRNQQREGMQSASPIGEDKVGYKTPAVSGAVGSMYPFGTTRVSERGGVDVGVHAINGSPVTVRRFDRKNGYNQITAGKIGSGKTFGTLIEILRNKAAYGDDLSVYLVDPLNGFKPILNLFGGKEVLVGGRIGLNPLDISETPDKAFEEIPDLDPYAEKKQQVIEFFEMFYSMQDRELGDSRDALSIAIEESYNRKGIYRDPSTHGNESPTIEDVIDVLRDMNKNPEDYTGTEGSDTEIANRIQRQASRLSLSFNEFEEGGQYNNLASQTEDDMDIAGEDIVYFNLSQQEGSGSLGLMMHLLLGQVYEQAKETDNKVLFCVDEAHYIMSDSKSLDFLEQAVRHSRHYDMGINFITQTLEEFFQHSQAEAIAQQCSLKRIHRLQSGLTEKVTDSLNLNESHVNFIKNAQAGDSDLGYSEALYGVDEYGYIPIRIYPTDFELETIQNAEKYIEE